MKARQAVKLFKVNAMRRIEIWKEMKDGGRVEKGEDKRTDKFHRDLKQLACRKNCTKKGDNGWKLEEIGTMEQSSAILPCINRRGRGK